MKLYQIVAKDVMRRKRRVLYAALGVIIAVMTFVGILTISTAGQAKIYNELDKYGANLSITPAINSIDMKLGDLNLGALAVGENYIPETLVPVVRRIADGKIREALDIKEPGDIATIAPKLYVGTRIKGASVMAVGIEPKEETKIKTWWKIGQGKYLAESDQAIVGNLAADVLKLNLGDKFDLNGREITVTGILEETGSGDDYQVFVPLSTLQKAFNKEGIISAIDVRALCNGCPVEVIADAINGQITGVRAVAVKQIAATEMGMVDKVNKFMLALAGVTLLLGAFGVVNTMMTSVHERIKDIGIMRAVGASRRQIIKAFVYEATIIGVIGGVLGYVLGTLMAYGVGPLIFEGTAIKYVLKYLPLSLLLAILVSVLSTSYPAFRATRIKVSDSFRAL
ncbi:MAG: ABC transporter permease [Dehalococcoidales bacterium]|nr:ABC transporter permease [Dehalococcoidales bacterium]